MYVPTPPVVVTAVPYTAWALERVLCSAMVFSLLWCTAKMWRTARANQRTALGDKDTPLGRLAASFERKGMVFPGRRDASRS